MADRPRHPGKPLATTIRYMMDGDVAGVLEIDGACFDPPWTAKELNEARRPIQRQAFASRMGYVIFTGEMLSGFMTLEMDPTSIEVTRLAIHPHDRRRGLGRALLAVALARVEEYRRMCLRLRVSEFNLAAQLWLREHGMKAVAVEHGRWAGGGDVYVFQAGQEHTTEKDNT